jgi:type I restriction enzyme M protein
MTAQLEKTLWAAEAEDDGVSFEEKVAAITANLKQHFEKSIELQERIKTNLKKIGIDL